MWKYSEPYTLFSHAGDGSLPSRLLFHASTVPACRVFIVPGVRVLVGAAINHLSAVFPAVKLSSAGLGGFVRPWCSRVRREAAEPRDVKLSEDIVLGLFAHCSSDLETLLLSV